jgi:hypothetical protein
MEDIKIKVNIAENGSLKFDQEVELKTQLQKEKYKKLFEDMQNFLSETVYENSGMTFEQPIRGTSENNENCEDNHEEELNESEMGSENNDENSNSGEPTREEIMQQEKERKVKEKLDELVNEIMEVTENTTEEETQEKDLIKLFRKMEKDKNKGMLSGYLFGETFEREKGQNGKTSGQLHKEIHRRMSGYTLKTIEENARRAVNVYRMFNQIGGKNKIGGIKNFTWNFISRLVKWKQEYIVKRVKELERGIKMLEYNVEEEDTGNIWEQD